MVHTQENGADSQKEQEVFVPAVEDRRLVVRLKMPQKEDHNIGFERKDENNQMTMIVYTGGRACQICGKVLKNGKAVGGHMRIHTKKSKTQDKDYSEKASKKKSLYKSSSSGDNSTNEAACAVCGKRFPSVKSLYGHMKSHPNRGWRGITPPSWVSKTSSSYSLSEVQKIGVQIENKSVDLLNDLWSRKVKRGRRSVAPVISREEDEGTKLQAAAKGLMLLGKVKRGRGSVAPVISREEDEGTKLQAAAKGLMLLGNGVDESELERGCSNERANLLRGKSIAQEENKPNYENTNSKEVVMKMRRKKLKLSDLTMEQVAEDKYKCFTCGKSFATFQALGGHRSSHSTNFKIINQKPCLYHTARGEEAENNGGEGVSSMSVTVEASASQVELPGESSQIVLGLDLNEMPQSMAGQA